MFSSMFIPFPIIPSDWCHPGRVPRRFPFVVPLIVLLKVEDLRLMMTRMNLSRTFREVLVVENLERGHDGDIVQLVVGAGQN